MPFSSAIPSYRFLNRMSSNTLLTGRQKVSLMIVVYTIIEMSENRTTLEQRQITAGLGWHLQLRYNDTGYSFTGYILAFDTENY